MPEYDYEFLSCVPLDEETVGAGDFEGGLKETKRYKAVLEKMFPQSSEFKCSFVRRGMPHDFGTYHEVCIKYETNDPASREFAIFVADNLPETWEDSRVMNFDHPSRMNVEAAETLG
ncbi:MAG TPA: hypothetical protein DEP37_01425 [Algoriphagus sp.]|nr:hypothetical protein [Algoriphagus sp.]|tara:strand:+ start:693 stop:1043 length:351 start_codon:yes stop_codon:yes gene_type:complete